MTLPLSLFYLHCNQVLKMLFDPHIHHDIHTLSLIPESTTFRAKQKHYCNQPMHIYLENYDRQVSKNHIPKTNKKRGSKHM